MERGLKAAFEAGELPGLHTVLVEQRGERLAEVYFPGEDENWGRPLGMREHGPEALHDLRSVTKSIVGLLYGIAMAEGKVPPPEAALLDGFPEYADLAADPARRRITVDDALSMRMGLEWDETLPYTDPRNSEIAMEMADDRYRFALDRPIIGPPGEVWTYSGGAVALIGRLIEAGVGAPIDEYAEEVLFRPLGIERYEWARGADGTASAASGLRLTARDLAKIGRLILADGVWEGRRVVPAEWLDASFQARADTGQGVRYGWLWWLAPRGDPPLWASGFGNGGQRLTVLRQAGLLVVVLAGNYNDPEAWRIPVSVIENHVAPALEARGGG
ncbi:MAG: serine hydrolase domain-containing protein [Pikeienuella sp.]